MNRPTISRATLAAALALVLALGTVPAYGVVHSDPVPSHAKVGTADLFQLSDADARSIISTGYVMPALKTVVVYADGHTFKFSPAGIATLNIDATLQQAYSRVDTVTPFDLKPVWTIDSAKISKWSATIAKAANDKPVDARRVVRKGALVLLAEKSGHTVNTAATTVRIRNLITYQLNSSSFVAKPIYASVSATTAKVTRKNIGKAILIRLSKFQITLYKGAKVEKRYRCAIGMPAYPTPTGLFKVTAKVKNPAWHNPGSDWSRHMPSVIYGGPNNPLGTRAIYTSAPGIRMHGVPASENWSIGHRASHGCLRMHRHDVEDLYPRVQVGIPVWIIK